MFCFFDEKVNNEGEMEEDEGGRKGGRAGGGREEGGRGVSRLVLTN